MSGYFWPETVDEGSHIVQQLNCNLEVISKVPSIFSQVKPSIFFLVGDGRASQERHIILKKFLDYVRAHPTVRFSIISTGWDTRPDQLLDVNIYRLLPPIPENCTVVTCRYLLSDMQIEVVRNILHTT